MTVGVMAGRDLVRRPDQPHVFLPPPPPVWQITGQPACKEADPVVFFGPDHEAPRVRAARVAEARAYCIRCPVTRQCLKGARERGEKFGVWGGADLEAERKYRPVKTARHDSLRPREAGQ